jgi:hypothetical protein
VPSSESIHKTSPETAEEHLDTKNIVSENTMTASLRARVYELDMSSGSGYLSSPQSWPSGATQSAESSLNVLPSSDRCKNSIVPSEQWRRFSPFRERAVEIVGCRTVQHRARESTRVDRAAQPAAYSCAQVFCGLRTQGRRVFMFAQTNGSTSTMRGYQRQATAITTRQ